MSQADDYARAIDIALHEVTEKYDTPELNALLGALATRAGMGLAMIEDQEMKKLMFEQVCTEIKRAMNVPSKMTAILVPIFPQKEDRKHS